jgi:hypothetical protein
MFLEVRNGERLRISEEEVLWPTYVLERMWRMEWTGRWQVSRPKKRWCNTQIRTERAQGNREDGNGARNHLLTGRVGLQTETPCAELRLPLTSPARESGNSRLRTRLGRTEGQLAGSGEGNGNQGFDLVHRRTNPLKSYVSEVFRCWRQEAIHRCKLRAAGDKGSHLQSLSLQHVWELHAKTVMLMIKSLFWTSDQMRRTPNETLTNCDS